jgi:hypothetical protein
MEAGPTMKGELHSALEERGGESTEGGRENQERGHRRIRKEADR